MTLLWLLLSSSCGVAFDEAKDESGSERDRPASLELVLFKWNLSPSFILATLDEEAISFRLGAEGEDECEMRQGVRDSKAFIFIFIFQGSS